MPPMVPAALPSVGIPFPVMPPELQQDEMGFWAEGAAHIPVLAAAAGLVLALLLPPSSAGKMMLQRRDLEMTGCGALTGACHSLAAGHHCAWDTQISGYL